VVRGVADASAQPAARDDPDPVQQPRALSGVAAARLRDDRAPAHDGGHRLRRPVLGRGGRDAGRPRRRGSWARCWCRPPASSSRTARRPRR
jgi:hypothetical protein